MENESDLSNIYSLKEFCKKFPSFPMSGLRHKIFFEEQYGLKKCGAVIKVGKSIFIDSSKFFKWLQDLH